MRLLLTGHRGFLGARVVQKLEAAGYAVVTIPGDLAEADALRSELDRIGPADVLVHLAGKSHGSWTELSRANVGTTVALLDACQERGLRRLVYASSGAVYGEPLERRPSQEDDQLQPTTVYGLTKLHAEAVVEFFERNHDWSGCVLRFPALYGPSARKGVVYDMLSAARSQGRIRIHGDGTQFRQFVHLEDAATAVVLAVQAGGSGPFNITSPLVMTVNELAACVKHAVGEHVEMIYAPTANQQLGLVLNGSRAEEHLGFRARHTSLELEAIA